MKVLIAAVAFSSEISGVQRHAFNVVRCLLRLPEIAEVHLVVAPWQIKIVKEAGFDASPRFVLHPAQVSNSSTSRNLWYLRKLPEMAAVLSVDIVHLSYPVPVNAKRFPCPVVLTLHDLYPYEIPRNFGFPQLIFNWLILRSCLRQVHSIACVSDTTLGRLRHYVPARVWNRSLRIYNCVEAGPSPSLESPLAGWHGEPFLLCVAQHRRNKNLPLLIRAFYQMLNQGQIEPSTGLVIVGIAGPETPSILKQIVALGLSRRVQLIEGLSEAELQWCYQNCSCLLAPSSTEGFGLPVAEGLLAGCRVVCSDIPAFREVGGDSCHYFALEKQNPDPVVRAVPQALKGAAPAVISLSQFSAKVLAAQYAAFYAAACRTQVAASQQPSASKRVAL
ncbi:glycosyltransferase family 4 protein [Silvibacterium acidisoli]|uniref:glycosyltransferase family 4 protein n=1 Tax=Acidobacteriaceae bacterium ZG23-2 TaxID=2883246 RepID=UPI00406CC846